MGYNSDEARDDHGRWTSGGGSGAGGHAHPANAARAHAGAQAHADNVPKGDGLDHARATRFQQAQPGSKADQELHAAAARGMKQDDVAHAIYSDKELKSFDYTSSGHNGAGGKPGTHEGHSRSVPKPRARVDNPHEDTGRMVTAKESGVSQKAINNILAQNEAKAAAYRAAHGGKDN